MSAPMLEDKEDNTFHEDQAGIASRTVTDFPCCFVFLAYMVGIGWIMAYSFENGEIRRLTHGFDYNGKLCGVDDAVADRPYLFWCGGPDNKDPFTGLACDNPVCLNFDDPICVSECPGDDVVTLPCPQPSDVAVSTNPEVHYPYAETTTTIIVQVVPQDSYPTKTFAGKYCMPKNLGLMKEILTAGSASSATSQFMAAIGSVRRGWHAIIGAGVLAFVLGYAYLAIMKIFAKPLVWAALISLLVSFLGAGGYLIATAGNTGDPDHPRANLFNQIGSGYEVEISYGVGGVLCLLGIVILVLITCAQKSIATAVACVEEACNTMFLMPSLLLQPALEVVVKIVVLGTFLYGFAWLVSVGDMHKNSASIGGKTINGVHRSFSYDTNEMYMILYYLLGFFWVDEIFTALGQFVISYSVVLYYFCPKDQSGYKEVPYFPLWKGYFNGVIFHIGTLAFGAAIIAIVRIIRAILLYIAKQAEKDGNAILACIAKCLACCVTFMKKCLEFLNKNAYMDVAIRSTWFCTAARNALKMIMQEAALMSLLNGACFVFQIAGGLLISGLGGYVSYHAVQSIDYFTANDSPGYVDNPMAVGVAGFMVASAIAYPFMITFDQCADTLLYCFVVDKGRSAQGIDRGDYAPDALRALIDNTNDK
jgi:hypothetical protein